MRKGFNGTQKLIDIAAGATVSILADGPVRRVTIDESTLSAEGAVIVPTGVLNYLIPNDGTDNGFTVLFSATTEGSDVPGNTQLPIQLGDDPGDHGPLGSILGNAAQTLGMGMPPLGASVLCKISSPAGATTIQVRQDF